MAILVKTIPIKQSFATLDGLRSGLEEASDLINAAFPAESARFAHVTRGDTTAESGDLRDAWKSIRGKASAARIDAFLTGGRTDEFRATLWFPAGPSQLEVRGEVKGTDRSQLQALATQIKDALSRNASEDRQTQ